MPYEFVEDLATADIAFRAWGKEPDEVFLSAADATMQVMVENLGAIKPREARAVVLENDQLDLLLFDFLQELIYYKDAEGLMLRIEKVLLREEAGRWVLAARAAGERLDPERHHTRVDVKAVTLHRFRLEKTEDGWEADVILDI
jgi:SHS2 domain-containing protein